MEKLIKYAIILLASAVLAYAAAVAISSILNLSFNMGLLIEKKTLIIFAIAYAALILIYLYNLIFSDKRKKQRILEGGGMRISAGLENAEYMTYNEIKSKFVVTSFSELPKMKDGIVLRCEQQKNKKDSDIYIAKPIHTMTIGTTGSGKTETDVNPTIRCLAHTMTKPSLIISDPKGELMQKHAAVLEKEGYEVLALDLREPFYSTKWNPLENLYTAYEQALTCDDEVYRVKAFDEISEELSDIASTIYPTKEGDFWGESARNFLNGILLAMIEDAENSKSGMCKEKFNFYNMTKIALNNEDEYELVKVYFDSRSSLSKSRELVSKVIGTAPNTRDGILTTMATKLALFSDRGICTLTSKNEIDISEFDERPTAVFLLIPDERESRHPLASLFVMQSYKELVKKANSQNNLALKRNVYYILDEFGNLPKLAGIASLVTVGRSRGIFLCPYVQSYLQLENKYGKDVAGILKSNCNIKKYIGTDDKQTNEEFSKLLGNYTIVQSSVSGSGDVKKDMNVSDSVHARPLIYPTELAQLNNSSEGGKNLGNTIIAQFGFKPLKTKFTPFFLNGVFEKTAYDMDKAKKVPTMPDEEKVFYDIKKACGYEPTNDGEEEGLDMLDTMDTMDKSESEEQSLIAQINNALEKPVLSSMSTTKEILEAIDEQIKVEPKNSPNRAYLLQVKRRLSE